MTIHIRRIITKTLKIFEVEVRGAASNDAALKFLHQKYPHAKLITKSGRRHYQIHTTP